MLIFTFAILSLVNASVYNDPASNQLVYFKQRTPGPVGIITTISGSPVDERYANNTLNTELLDNEFLFDTLSHLARERIPARFVHAKAAGAFGYFEVTHDISDICKANFLSAVGKKTPIAVRFSQVIGEVGASDVARDVRGFAVKFYTEEGNFDLPGLNIPVFPVKDPLFFQVFVHSQKPNPATHTKDDDMLWDFITSRPESLHAFMYFFGDRGIPNGYRYLPGFGIHTYQVVNADGEVYFVRFHILPTDGIKTLTSEESSRITGIDLDYGIRDLYNAIGRGEYPTYNVSVQVLSYDDVQKAEFDVFDVTLLLPEDIYPLHPVGRLVLNVNPVNYFAEIEQLAFCPGNLVPGIVGAPDKLFQFRRFSYRDAQFYRLGTNFYKIPVNSFRTPDYTYMRDGVRPVSENYKDIPNYHPNSFHGPVPYREKNAVNLIKILEDPGVNNFWQIRDLYNNKMSQGEKSRLINNIVNSLGDRPNFLKDRAVNLYKIINLDLGNKIELGIQGPTNYTNASY